MKFTIDSTTDQVQNTGGIALAAKISNCNVNLLNLATISPVQLFALYHIFYLKILLI